MRKRLGVVTIAMAIAATMAGSRGAAAADPKPRLLVVCAPGYPGTTAQAQTTMDGFARVVGAAAGWPEGRLGAVYHESLAGGVARLRESDAALALVTLPFFLQEGRRLGLAPRLQAVPETGASEIFSLVARRGAVSSAASLDGWEVTGSAGYAPAFVSGPILASWGTLPPTTRITFAPAALSALRRAAAGEKLAVILDAAATAALPGLPFAAQLEVVTRSRPLPASLLCTVGKRLTPSDSDAVVHALERLPDSAAGVEALRSIRLSRFQPIDTKELEAARQVFASAQAPPDAAPSGASR
jgi:hypothetical protein